uniref:Uncharacterized protein n=1 Tax=Triticum urartu TaxID=4572 RepID=A0A8R7U727_TRIUA
MHILSLWNPFIFSKISLVHANLGNYIQTSLAPLMRVILHFAFVLE